MEPRARAAGALSATRIRLGATCALLVGLVFVQDAGLLVPDTKLDLVLDPSRFLERALQLWDPASAFGQLQNQAYGYLWPMGPFFWVGDLLGAPGWVVQRAWWAMVLCTAFLGAALLLRALGLRRDLAVIVAALAYALSPRLLTVLGPISIEGWPSALAPWVLLPLVVGSERGSPRRAAALSALAVAMVGGVNAAATFAVLPLGAVWLLTRERGPRRHALMLWWPVFTLLGTLWWLVPLFTLGAYSPPFLDFIESASVTTFPTTLFDALRGTSNWVPYVSASSRAGNDLLTQGHLAVMSAVVVTAGLVGLLDRRQPHRWWLVLSLVVGLVMVTAGHLGTVQGIAAPSLHEALDGALAPLRNVHKFDPVVRLPLVVGLAWTLQRLLDARPERLGRLDRGVALGVVLMTVSLAASPALLGRLAPSGGFLDVPDYWRAAGAFLEQEQDGQEGTALLLPGSAFGSYVWGDPRDEPFQALTRAEWAVRNQIPLTPPGNIRMLDRIEGAVARGEGSVALTEALRRAGVGWLVVRGDLRPDGDVPDPALVRQALRDSPGLRPVAAFGPEVGGEAHLYDGETRVVVNGGWQQRFRAVEVWEVTVPRPSASLTARPEVVVGGPEDLLDLEELGVVDDGATVLAPDVVLDDEGAPAGPLDGAAVVLSDGLRDRERNFARVHDGYSHVRLPGDERRTGNPNQDYLTEAQGEWLTTGDLTGVEALVASSSASDATAVGGSDRGQSPFAAIDGDPTTQWTADPAATGRDRWSVRLAGLRDLTAVTVTGGEAAGPRQLLRVETPTWRSEAVAVGPGEEVQLSVAGARSDRLDVVQADGGSVPLAIAEVSLPGLEVGRRLVLPQVPRSWGSPDAVVLRADLESRQGCAVVAGGPRCTASEVRASEEATGMSRRFVLPERAAYVPQLRVRPRPGPGLAELLTRAQPVNVSASSSGVPDPRAGAGAAVDGRVGTAWVAQAQDLAPTLSLSWLTPQRLTGLRAVVADDTPVSRPRALQLRWPGGTREVALGEDGTASFPALTTDRLEVEVTGIDPAVDLDFAAAASELPAGIGELELRGADLLPLVPSTQPVERSCGSGPSVEVDGEVYGSALTASDADLLAGTEVPARLCDTDAPAPSALVLDRGVVDVTVTPSAAFEATSLVLSRPGRAVPATEEESRGAGLVALRHNENPGWVAEAGGVTAPGQVVDGWRQGFATQDDAPVTRRFAPDATYRAGLAVGLLALTSLVLVAAVGGRRRRSWERVRAAQPRPLAAAAVAAVGGLLLAGWPGLALAAVLGGLTLVGRRWSAAPVLAAAAVVGSSAAYWWRPWGDLDGWAGTLAWPAYLALAPVLVAVLLAARPPESPRSLAEGRSTSR